MRHTCTRTLDRFLLQGDLPKSLYVRQTSPPEHATATYSVIADYGWAVRILCSGSCRDDANDIADCIGEVLEIPVHQAEELR